MKTGTNIKISNKNLLEHKESVVNRANQLITKTAR